MSAACPTTEHLRLHLLYKHPEVGTNITNLFFLAPSLQPGEIPFSQPLLVCSEGSSPLTTSVAQFLQFVKIPPALGLGLEGVPKEWTVLQMHTSYVINSWVPSLFWTCQSLGPTWRPKLFPKILISSWSDAVSTVVRDYSIPDANFCLSEVADSSFFQVITDNFIIKFYLLPSSAPNYK